MVSIIDLVIANSVFTLGTYLQLITGNQRINNVYNPTAAMRGRKS